MKVEAVQYEPSMDRETMRQNIFEYIEIDYNKKRSHSSLGYLSPEKYEKTTRAKEAIEVKKAKCAPACSLRQIMDR